MKIKITLVLTVIVFGIVNLAPTPSLHAAPAKPDITITPFLQEVKIQETDATKTFTVSLTNNSPKAQVYNLSALDFGSLDSTGGLVYAGSDASTLTGKYGLVNWLTLDTKKLNVAPGKTEKVQATIVNDDSMEPGGHYAAIIASLDSQNSSKNRISVNQQLSSLVFATKMGGEAYDLKLDKINPELSNYHLPNKISLRFSNPGNVHVVPRGTVQIVTSSGKVLQQGIINEPSSFVLPGTTRTLHTELSKLASPHILPTHYSIIVRYRYDSYDQTAVKVVNFSYTNYAALILIVLLLCAVTSALYYLIRHKKLRITKKLKNVKNAKASD